MSFFDELITKEKEIIWHYHDKYLNDTFPKKIDLTLGSYKDTNGNPYIFKVVKQAEEKIINDYTLDKEYLDLDGNEEFKRLSQKLMFGDCKSTQQNRICTIQTIAGSGALRLACDLMMRIPRAKRTIYVSSPTWGNHVTIMESAGLTVKYYPYYEPITNSIKLDDMLETLSNIEPYSVILLHLCSHNPTGVDPTHEEWKQICHVIKEKKLFPFFDCAYQGFASGDVVEDVWAVRYFEQQNIEMFVAHSFSKNMGLYGERIGALHNVCNDANKVEAIYQNTTQIIGNSYNTPQLHGARIVSTILSTPNLYDSWLIELKSVADRLIDMRSILYRGLISRQTPGNWEFIVKQKGMFTFLPLTEKQALRLIHHWHCYIMPYGRVSIPGLNQDNIDYFTDCLDETVRSLTSNHE